MTNNQLTDKRLAQLAKRNFCQTKGEEYTPFGDEVVSMAAELQERRKADSEPVGEFYEDGPLNWYQISDGDRVPAHRRIPLYRHAQPAPERDQVRSEHAEWSQATFGNVGPVGPLKHLSKEALEAAAEPGDLSEWADMQLLLWDAQRRAGITDEQITQAMIEKLAVNKQREWPEPKDGEPRLHIKAQPAPVVHDEREAFEAFMAKRFGDLVDQRRAKNGDYGYMAWDMVVAWAVWQARAAMLQAEPVTTANKLGNSPALSVWYGCMPETNGKTNWTAILYRNGECIFNGITIDISEYPDRVRYEADRMRHLIGELKEEPDILKYDADAHSGYVSPREVAGNSPVIPNGYVMVPKEPTQAMCAAFNDSDYGRKSLRERYVAMLAAAPQEVKP